MQRRVREAASGARMRATFGCGKDDAEPWVCHDSASSHGVPGRYRYCPVGTACTGFGFSSLRASVVSTLTYTMRSPLRPAIFAQSSGLLVRSEEHTSELQS